MHITTARPGRYAADVAERNRTMPVRPWMVIALLLAVMMLSLFAVLLVQQVDRGEATRTAWRQQTQASVKAGVAPGDRHAAATDRAVTRMASR